MLHAAGSVGPDFIRVAPPARPAAMGSAFSALANDVSSPVYNPAGLSLLRKPAVSFTHYVSFADTLYEQLCFGMPINGFSIGASFMYVTTTDFKEYDEFGVNVGNVENYDLVFTGTYARQINSSLYAGLNAKFFYSVLYGFSKKGVAFDAGMIMKFGEDPDTYGSLVVQNVGFQDAYIEVVDSMPVNLKAGIGTKFRISPEVRAQVAVDVNRLVIKDENPTLETGVELTFLESMSLRVGYGFRHDDSGLTAGIGLKTEQVKFGYAFKPFEMLGTEHRISVEYEFN